METKTSILARISKTVLGIRKAKSGRRKYWIGARLPDSDVAAACRGVSLSAVSLILHTCRRTSIDQYSLERFERLLPTPERR